MKYIDFKNHLAGAMLGDKNVPDFVKLKPIMLECMTEVAIQCEPLCLMGRDVEDDILKTMENGLFIRKPNIPVDNDEHIIDMDETLVYAVSYLVAYKLSKNNQAKNEKDAKKIINNYQWKRYNDTKDNNYEFDITAAENSMDIHGYKKIYIRKYKTVLGYVWVWDDNFIKILGGYLSGLVQDLSKSDRNNIDKYLEYKSIGNSDSEMYKALDKYLWEK